MIATKKGTFSIKEDIFIRNHYLSLSDKQIAYQLGRNQDSIKSYRKNNNLQKPVFCNLTNKSKSKTPKKNGDTSIYRDKSGRQYRYVRVAPGKWVKEHYLKFEAFFGPIPKGFILRCRTSDTLNTDINNWTMVTRSANALLTNAKMNYQVTAATVKRIWGIVKTMEANGLKSRYKLKSHYKKTVTNNIASLPNINRTADFNFF